MRGEQIKNLFTVLEKLGSPPLARGTVKVNTIQHDLYGITPACAGNRLRLCAYVAQLKDHPRLRGEQRMPTKFEKITQGSPPLARGTGGFSPLLYRDFRITPACAGNRSSGTLRTLEFRDHPRLRGEQSKRWLLIR